MEFITILTVLYIEEVIDRLQGFPRKEHFREAPEEPIP